MLLILNSKLLLKRIATPLDLELKELKTTLKPHSF